MAQAMGTGAVAGETTLERFERFWTAVIDSFATNRQVWLATFDIFTMAQRDPEVRAAVADGIEDGRKATRVMCCESAMIILSVTEHTSHLRHRHGTAKITVRQNSDVRGSKAMRWRT